MRTIALRAFLLSFVGGLALLYAGYNVASQLGRQTVETPRGPLPVPAAGA